MSKQAEFELNIDNTQTSVTLGPMLKGLALARGESDEALIDRLLTIPTAVTITDAGAACQIMFIPGHTITVQNGRVEKGPFGPITDQACSVAIVGKMPWKDEIRFQQLFVGQSGSLLFSTLASHGLDVNGWYLTNVVKFPAPNADGKLKQSWLTECKPLLEYELRLLKPKYILVLGSDAVKTMFGKNASIERLRGAHLEYQGAQVVVAMHPSAVMRDPRLTSGFTDDIAMFANRLKDVQRVVTKKDYFVINNDFMLGQVVDQLLTEKADKFFVDCEWGGLEGSEYSNGGKLRTIQFARKPHEAFLIHIRSEGMSVAYKSPIATIGLQLTRLFCRSGVRLAAHMFRSDIKWLDDENRPTTSEIRVPCTQQFADGFDTLTGYHVWQPQAENFGLEALSVQLSDCGRYDLEVMRWLDNDKKNGHTADQYGYAFVPDRLLIPYAFCDVDVGIQAWPRIEEALKQQKLDIPYTLFGTPINTMYDFHQRVVHSVGPELDTIERTGIYTDRERILKLTELFSKKKVILADKLQKLLNWPEFNFQSSLKLSALLYGRKADKVLPPHVKSFNLMPVKTTGKPARDWNKLSAAEQLKKNPAVDAESLKILAERATDPYIQQVLAALKQAKLVNQVCNNFLRAPQPDAAGNLCWTRGLVSEIDCDSRTRTSLGQLTDTGRYTSAGPNMQNLSKKQETELRKVYAIDQVKLEACKGWQGMSDQELKDLGLLHPDYYSLRSCYMATPGQVIIEADYIQAELNAGARIAKDAKLISILEDPTRDLHSEMAVKSFKLDYAPSEVKKRNPAARILGKAVVLGVWYGRGARAIARAAQAEGADTSIFEAQLAIDAFFSEFPGVKQYIENCHAAVVNPGYVTTMYGRRRYFFPTLNNEVIAKQQREAGNTPIQGTVGDTLTVAISNFRTLRQEMNLKSRILLPIHDALLFDVPVDEIEVMRDVVIPTVMTHGARIPVIDITLAVDIKVMFRWNEEVKESEVHKAIEASNQFLSKLAPANLNTENQT
jgi:uracil-DNA glycosylase family 4